jgi:hypothetical protein
VDYPSKEERFELVYMLLSLTYNTRIKVGLTDNVGGILINKPLDGILTKG